MHILVSNDDGYSAPGIISLASALKEVAYISVVAPMRDCSGASHSLTLDRPLRARHWDNGVISVDGTPSDCVHLAINGLIENEPDMVVSGINSGANMGDDVLYSGTVAAAMEGRHLGYPSIAVSMNSMMPDHYETGARVAKILVSRLCEERMPAAAVLNVNVPDLPFDQLKGFKATRLGQRHRAEPVVAEKDPRGRPVFWIGAAGSEADGGPGTDFHAVNNGYVSITPIHYDLTSHREIDSVGNWLECLR